MKDTMACYAQNPHRSGVLFSEWQTRIPAHKSSKAHRAFLVVSDAFAAIKKHARVLLPLPCFFLLAVSASAQTNTVFTGGTNGQFIVNGTTGGFVIAPQTQSLTDALPTKWAAIVSAVVLAGMILGRVSAAIETGAKALPAILSVFKGSANVPPPPAVATPDLKSVPIGDLHAELTSRVQAVAPTAVPGKTV